MLRRCGMALAALALAACGGSAHAGPPVPPVPVPPVTVQLRIHHSHFQPDVLALPSGALVRFVVTNNDPIDHELIVGDDATQNRHEFGTDAHHDAPGEVSVPSGATRTTEVTVRTGFEYACHLPGHYAYGMKGTIRLR
ncbi:MAG: hypothetical protein JWO37_2918 [Acidimicrobiales bacterium]|jgi:uncharacterized cupredoxin-like copper-binding protein|nr:hypothetical protein [Acidimicrobiales bacterium]